ncbi:MAG: TonB-dependent receptor [Candidatus Electryonea clarkiae]|nr:TonB-dependent receptor [Candidatus Electryonea clarkiae]MDP8287453.1 TonB-dependent receptor [Candidatus Electryonea clarkiae]
MKSIINLILSFSLVLFAATKASAEKDISENGIVFGTVLNQDDRSPAVGANVILRGTSLGAATDLDGNFRIGNVPPTIYAVQVSAIGFMPMVQTDVVINNVRPVEVNFSLKPTVLQLEEVKITPGYFRKESDVKTSVVTQSNEEIRRIPGSFEDIVRAISILPGVAQASSGRNDLVVRGGAPSENLYIIENIEVPNINHFGTQGSGGGPASYVNLDFVERISFSTGGFGAKYGDRLSSVLTINLKEPRRDQFGGKATISASQFGLNLETPIAGDRGGIYFSARRSYLDFIFKAAGFPFVPEYWDFLVKSSYDLSPNDKLTFTGITTLDNIRQFNDTPDQKYFNSNILNNSQKQFTYGATWKRFFSNSYSTLTFSQNTVEFVAEQMDSTRTLTVFKNNSFEQETSVRGEIVYKLDSETELTSGIVEKLVRFDTDLLLPPFQIVPGDSISIDQRLKSNSIKSAAYLQLSRKLGFLNLTFGGRGDHFDILDNGMVFSPRFGASYPITSRTTINASAGRYYQAPSYVWLVANQQNRKLDYLGADQVVLGVEEFIRSDVRVQIEGYYKKYFNYPASLSRPYLVMVNTGAGFGGKQEGFASYGLDPLLSAGDGWSRGIELFVQKKMSEHRHYGTGSLSYSQTMFTGIDGVERFGSWDQRWIFNLGWGWMLKQSWEISAKFRLATGRPFTPYNPDGTLNSNLYNSRRIETNHSLDLRVDKFFPFDHSNLIVYIDVQNVYNNKNNDIPNWDAREGRSIEQEDIGLLPSIGISYEF